MTYAPYAQDGDAAYAPGASYGQAPPPPAPPGQRSRGRRRLAILAVVAVLAIVAMLIVLNLVGVLSLGFLPGKSSSPSGSSGSENAMTFYQAENVANGTASTRGGGWQVGFAGAISESQATNPPSTEPCDLTGYAPASSSLPAGEAYTWGFIFLATPFSLSAPDKELFVVVDNGSGTVTTQLNSTASCPGLGFPLGGPLPLNVSNSPSVVARFQALGAAGFLAKFPTASFDMSVGGVQTGFSAWFPEWSAYYFSSCSSTTSTESEFGAAFYAANLTVFAHGWSNSTCTPSSTVDTVSFAPVSSGHSTVGSVKYDNLSISAPSGFTSADLGLAILEPNKTLVTAGDLPLACEITPYTDCGGAPPEGGWYAILLSGGSPVATYPNSPANDQWNTRSGAVAITSSVTLEIVSLSTLSGSGDSLLAFTYNGNAVVSGSATL